MWTFADVIYLRLFSFLKNTPVRQSADICYDP